VRERPRERTDIHISALISPIDIAARPFLSSPGPLDCVVLSGLLTTVGYQLSAGGPATYCLEGSVAYAGLLVQWLRDNLQVGPNLSPYLSPYLGLLVPLNIPAHVARAP